MNTLIQQGHIKLVKSVSKDFKINTFTLFTFLKEFHFK